jgi:hypothetical protein
MSDELKAFLEANPPNPVFTPYVFFNVDGDQLEVYWDNEADYGEVKGEKFNVMCLHIGQDSGKPVGVCVYSIKKVLDKAGFKIVPKDESDKMSGIEALRNAMLHCSHYESGTRYCDFCHAELAGFSTKNPGVEKTEHRDSCPFLSLKHSD